jgi:hypothetical protein
MSNLGQLVFMTRSRSLYAKFRRFCYTLRSSVILGPLRRSAPHLFHRRASARISPIITIANINELLPVGTMRQAWHMTHTALGSTHGRE